MDDSLLEWDENSVRIPVEGGEYANPDQLPDRLCPTEGCASCGSAFVRIEAFVIDRPDEATVSMEIVRDDLFATASLPPLRVQAVELLCCEGHAHIERRRLSWSDMWWASSLIMGVSAMAMLYGKGQLT